MMRTNGRRVASLTLALTVCLTTTRTYAFGLGDIVSIGVEAGGKLVGAAVGAGVDKVKDAMRDPEAEAEQKREEERKLAEQFQRQVNDIETRNGLRPLDRERMVIALNQQYAQAQQFKAFVERQEALQREHRDKVFTLGGLAGVVGEAAMHTPTVITAQADAMVKAGIPQAQSRAVLAKADAAMASGAAQAKARSTFAHVDAAMAAGAQETDAIQKAVDAVSQHLPSGGVTVATAPVAGTAAAIATVQTSPAPPLDAFSGDLGRKLYLEFVGSPTLTAEIRQRLAGQGHVMAATPDEADVQYRIEGEYIVSETKQYDGLSRDVGAILEDPAKPIPAPEKKLIGSIKLGVASALFGLAAIQGAAQGKQVPQGMAPPAQTGFRQQLLLVAARQPRDGKETRVSARRANDGDIAGAQMAAAAKVDLFEKLGIR